MPERNFSSGNYRYGFNGKEQDPEIKGEGAQYDYGFRIYDPRIGKFLSIDPLFKSYPWYTPYQFAGNGPILNIDLDGLEEVRNVSTTTAIKKITQTGAPNDNTTVTTMKITYRHDAQDQVDKVVTIIHFKAGLDIDTDGSPSMDVTKTKVVNGKTETYTVKRSVAYPNDEYYDEETAYPLGKGKYVDANTVPYVTVPSVLTTGPNKIRGYNLAFVMGPEKETGEVKLESATVGDNSGAHAGEVSAYLARKFGYAQKGNSKDAPERSDQGYDYYYIPGVNIGASTSIIESKGCTDFYRNLIKGAIKKITEQAQPKQQQQQTNSNGGSNNGSSATPPQQ